MPRDSECANPLLLEWVMEWLDLARERNTKGVQTYKKAYDSLKSCPLPFNHPSEVQQLHGFGPKLCDRLTEKMAKHCAENGLPMPELPHKAGKSKRKDGDVEDEEEAGTKQKAKPKKAYVPALRSGAYALILALATLDEEASTGLTKAETIELAQPFCDSSFSAPSDPGKFYTAWSSMKTLVGKDLVYEKGRPLRRYALTEEGWETAKRIQKTNVRSGQQDVRSVASASATSAGPTAGEGDVFSDIDNDDESQALHDMSTTTTVATAQSIIPVGREVSDESPLPTFSPITIPPGAYTVELVLDIREIRAKKDRDYMQNELLKKGVTPIMRALELGDILWVAKLKDPGFLAANQCEGDEIVLDYIVERKRLDDLVGSIKDGRFHEQKFRLRKSGVKNVIYIIEEISMAAEVIGKYEEAVESAVASMQVVNGYFVKRTQKMDDTIRYLARMTALLQEVYRTKTLHVIPTTVLTSQNHQPLLKHLTKVHPSRSHYTTYPAFASLASKSESLTLRDVFLKMLMCTRGVTGEKALEIQKKWKTPREFLEAFEKAGAGHVGEEGKKRKRALVMDEMGSLVARKKIAKVLSGKIAEVWSDV